jgi:hypothetical protein
MSYAYQNLVLGFNFPLEIFDLSVLPAHNLVSVADDILAFLVLKLHLVEVVLEIFGPLLLLLEPHLMLLKVVFKLVDLLLLIHVLLFFSG